jgi:hypothetical protein
LTALVNWTVANAGFQLGNAAVVVANQNAATGNPEEIEILTSGAVHVIVDIAGVFAAPTPTQLECVTQTSTSSFLGFVVASCPAGYTLTGGGCKSSSIRDHTYEADLSDANTYACGFFPESSFTIGTTLTAQARCCRVPGL